MVENLPVGFASTHEQRQPGRTQGHDHKPQLEAQQREVQRPGEDRGRQPSPLGPDWMPLCVGKRRNDRQISHPEHANAQAGSPPHQRHAREAFQLSDLSPRRGAVQSRVAGALAKASALTQIGPEASWLSKRSPHCAQFLSAAIKRNPHCAHKEATAAIPLNGASSRTPAMGHLQSAIRTQWRQ